MNIWHEKISKKPDSPIKIILSFIEEGFCAHWHQEIEIIYVLEGEVQVGLNNDIYLLKQGDIFTISSCDIHRFFPNPMGCKKVILQMGKSIFDNYADLVFNRRFIIPLINMDFDVETQRDVNLYQFLKCTIMSIYYEWVHKASGYELAIKSRFNDLALAIIRQIPMEAHSPKEKSKRLHQLEKLDTILKYIEDNYNLELTLKIVADLSGYSTCHFSRIFNEVLGVGFTEYINTYRIKMATNYLINSEMPITEIAFRTGFNSIETFNRLFKKENSCTPTEFRNKR